MMFFPFCAKHVRIALGVLLLSSGFTLPASAGVQTPASAAAEKRGGPTDPKAVKTYANALDWEKKRYYPSAIDDFRKANKQDDGHCRLCLTNAYALALKIGSYKDAVEIARDELPQAETDAENSSAHFCLAIALQKEGIREKNDALLTESSREFKSTLDLAPAFAAARYHWGITLANLRQDDSARAQFSAFLGQDHSNANLHERAQRLVDRVELARATMAPPFTATTLDGQNISLDSLAGKVVLIDFWATWCGPCREALPRMQAIAHKFEGQPLVLLSISLDKDDARWKSFVDKNKMTWLQVRDGGLDGSVAKMFNVRAIPATFSIDADGILEDQHVGDADIEGKLRKMVGRAVEVANRKPVPPSSQAVNGSGS